MNNLFKFKHLIVSAVLTLSFFPFSKVYAASYSVIQGDSLYSIGKAFGTTSDYLIQENNLNNSTIYPGQILQVPSSIYTVKYGDSLYLIAKNYGLPLNLLRKINNKWTDNLYVGEKLLLPSNVLVPKTGTSYLSSGDIDLLSRLISAEAAGESYEAKVAVGAVVLNRVKDTRFPNTLTSVIYEKSYGYYQFTPVENGYINKAADSDSIKAAYAVSSGADPTKGALYYFDDSATNKWLWSRPLALRIGKMVYTY
ncbi:MAG: cell wall hydrolase [Solirubrobacterales bacterium]